MFRDGVAQFQPDFHELLGDPFPIVVRDLADVARVCMSVSRGFLEVNLPVHRVALQIVFARILPKFVQWLTFLPQSLANRYG